MIRLTREGPILSASPAEVALARDAWERVHHLAIPDILDPNLSSVVARGLERTTFVPRVNPGIGTELYAEDGSAVALLQFITNDPRLFQIVRELCPGGPLVRCFQGRIYRFVPGTAHEHSWHSDTNQTRVIALSINLGAEPYQGGVLQNPGARVGARPRRGGEHAPRRRGALPDLAGSRAPRHHRHGDRPQDRLRRLVPRAARLPGHPRGPRHVLTGQHGGP